MAKLAAISARAKVDFVPDLPPCGKVMVFAAAEGCSAAAIVAATLLIGDHSFAKPLIDSEDSSDSSESER